MRYLILTLLIILTAFPSLADDTPEVVEVARFGRGTAYTLAWRPDGEVLAVVSSTGVWFFDENFNELEHWQSDNEIYELEWSPTGEQLVMANRSKSDDLCFTSVWQVSEDFSFTIIAVPEICPTSINWSSDGNYFAVGGTVDRVYEDGHSVAIIFNSESFSIEEYLNLGAYVAFSPDSQYLAINQDYDNQGMTILNIETDEIIQTIDSPEVMNNVEWSPDGKYISSTCNDYELFQNFWGDCIWDVNTGELIYAEELSRVKWHPKKLEFLDTGYSPWGDSHQSSWLRLHTELTNEVAFDTFYIDIIHHPEWHPSGEYFVALSSQNLISFNGFTGEVVEIHELFSMNANLLSWIPQSNNLLSISQSGFDGESTANVWSLDSNDMREPYKQTAIPDIDEIQWIEGTQNFVVHSYGGLGRYFLTEWNADSLEQVSKLWEHFEQDAAIPYIRYTSNLERIAYYWSEYTDEIVITGNLFEIFQNNNNTTIEVQADRILQIEWSPDDSMIATAGEFGDGNFL